jgi:hypothetical protein
MSIHLFDLEFVNGRLDYHFLESERRATTGDRNVCCRLINIVNLGMNRLQGDRLVAFSMFFPSLLCQSKSGIATVHRAGFLRFFMGEVGSGLQLIGIRAFLAKQSSLLEADAIPMLVCFVNLTEIYHHNSFRKVAATTGPGRRRGGHQARRCLKDHARSKEVTLHKSNIIIKHNRLYSSHFKFGGN